VTRYFMAVLALAIVVGSLLQDGAAAETSRAPSPTGDPRGVALLARVEKAYRTVPGVELSIPSLLRARVKFDLRLGVVVAAESVFTGPGGTITTLVRRSGGRTFIRQPRKSCWQPSVGFSIDEIGEPLVGTSERAVQAPRRIAGGWSLRVKDGHDTPAIYLINSPSYLLRSLTAWLVNGTKLVYYVQNLTSAPRVQRPWPRC
jgi:hypothetical protein